MRRQVKQQFHVLKCSQRSGRQDHVLCEQQMKSTETQRRQLDNTETLPLLQLLGMPCIIMATLCVTVILVTWHPPDLHGLDTIVTQDR